MNVQPAKMNASAHDMNTPTHDMNTARITTTCNEMGLVKINNDHYTNGNCMSANPMVQDCDLRMTSYLAVFLEPANLDALQVPARERARIVVPHAHLLDHLADILSLR